MQNIRNGSKIENTIFLNQIKPSFLEIRINNYLQNTHRTSYGPIPVQRNHTQVQNTGRAAHDVTGQPEMTHHVTQHPFTHNEPHHMKRHDQHCHTEICGGQRDQKVVLDPIQWFVLENGHDDQCVSHEGHQDDDQEGRRADKQLDRRAFDGLGENRAIYQMKRLGTNVVVVQWWWWRFGNVDWWQTWLHFRFWGLVDIVLKNQCLKTKQSIRNWKGKNFNWKVITDRALS